MGLAASCSIGTASKRSQRPKQAITLDVWTARLRSSGSDAAIAKHWWRKVSTGMAAFRADITSGCTSSGGTSAYSSVTWSASSPRNCSSSRSSGTVSGLLPRVVHTSCTTSTFPRSKLPAYAAKASESCLRTAEGPFRNFTKCSIRISRKFCLFAGSS